MIYKKEPFIQILMPFKNLGLWFFCVPPEGGLGSSWLKHALKQRSPPTLIGVVGAAVVLVLERAFVVGGEVAVA